jgi:F0F1-type ATP synthase membrane subunit b/b'
MIDPVPDNAASVPAEFEQLECSLRTLREGVDALTAFLQAQIPSVWAACEREREEARQECARLVEAAQAEAASQHKALLADAEREVAALRTASEREIAERRAEADREMIDLIRAAKEHAATIVSDAEARADRLLARGRQVDERRLELIASLTKASEALSAARTASDSDDPNATQLLDGGDRRKAA